MLSFHAEVVHFTFYIVMVFKVLENFVVAFKTKAYLWKLLLVKMLCSISPVGFYEWVKALKLVSVFSNAFLIF